jgi:hypothetical protein
MRTAIVMALLLAIGTAHAQSARPGMRLTVTRVAPSGGFTASGLLVVRAASITREPAPGCGAGAVRVTADGRDTRGRIRAAHLVAVAGAVAHSASVGSSHCDAQIALTLDDGSTVTLTRGSITAHLVNGTGLDATVDGSVVDAAGVPTTVTGHIVLSPAS